MLYVKLRKALYGIIKVALLFWRLLRNTEIEWGFKLNEYDKCAANKTTRQKQCTIIWHVDKIKISHVDKYMVEDIVEKISN